MTETISAPSPCVGPPAFYGDRRALNATAELNLGPQRRKRHSEIAAHRDIAAHRGQIANGRAADRSGRCGEKRHLRVPCETVERHHGADANATIGGVDPVDPKAGEVDQRVEGGCPIGEQRHDHGATAERNATGGTIGQDLRGLVRRGWCHI
jgi:hypothetical protein